MEQNYAPTHFIVNDSCNIKPSQTYTSVKSKLPVELLWQLFSDLKTLNALYKFS